MSDTKVERQQLPSIIGLPAKGQTNTFLGRITRAHLIIGGLILLGILSLSLLITVIVQAATHRKETTDTTSNSELCLTRGCLAAASHQMRSIDKTAWNDRCTNFYQYACGTWEQSHPIQSFEVERTILGDLIERRNEDIERLLDAPVSRSTERSWEWKVKTYYTECLDDYARVPASGKAMIDLIQDNETIQGWFLIDNGAEGASQEYLLKNQTVFKQISHIHGDLGATVIFDLRAGFDDSNSKAKRLEFSPAGLSMDVNDYLNSDTVSETRRSAYRLYILEILTLLSQDATISDGNLGDRMFTIAEDIMFIEKDIAQAMKFSKDNGDKGKTMTLGEMFNMYSFDFLEYLSHVLEDASIVSSTTSVYVTSPLYFEKVFSILSMNNNQTYARRIHNYMRWRLVRTYIEDLSYNYLHAHRIFLDSYFGAKLHSTNEAYCTREVIRRFPLAIQRLYTMNSTTHSGAVATVTKIFDALKDGFRQYIDEQATWMMDESTKTVAREKIAAMTSAIGYASIASDDGRLDDYYERFAVSDRSHFENAYSYHRFHSWAISNSLTNPDLLEHWDSFERRASQLYDYIAMFNRLFVIASAMHVPLVDSDWPLPVNMGSIGVLLAQKLFSSIDSQEGRTHSADGTLIADWWSSQTANAYNTSRQCITNYYVNEVKSLSYNVNGAQIVVRLAGEPFSLTTLRQIGALRFAYTAMKKSDQLKSLTMPGTNLTSDQSFFLAYAQTQCFKRQELLQLVRTQVGIYDEGTALNAALIHMPEFSKAFQCPTKDATCF
ncbi:unnamed protein product [Adineta ricciae]|uniref:Uncharacterized protein n=1 Tax=Adineta ricciae TaxID=249248 RepID=A0A815UJZ8_ADIRI|nr:unnamed protein product [Adineta ricciae]